MRVVGLTGGIGSGKSTVARILADHGAVVVDADQVARQVVEPGEPALAEIAARFGDEVIGPDGTLDRQALADVVFADEEARGDLESITHPRIGERILQQVVEAQAAEDRDGVQRVVVIDHPLLVESGAAADYETVIVVVAPVEVRVTRLVARGLREADARARIATQADDAARAAVATHVVDNAGTMDDLRAQIAPVLADLGLDAR